MQTTSLLVRKRIAALFFLFTLGIFLLGGRVFWVQFVRGAELSEKAEQNRMRDEPVASKRGIIYDRNGNELAISVSADSVCASPADVIVSKKEKEIAHKLAALLDMDEEKLLKTITRRTLFVWVKRQIKPEQAQKIREMDLPGIRLTEESHRQYPNGIFCSHVLGISGIDNTGLEGIDKYYDDLVGGSKGYIVVEKDAWNRNIPEATHKYISPVDGANLILTIDETIQYIVEREIEKVFQERGAKSVAVIVMDPATGEILALASRPTFDPNNYGKYPATNRRNFAINDAYEPGSTMKIITAAMAMEEKVVDGESRFFCPGHIKVGKETIRCAHGRAHGSQTFAQIVENSCNVGFVQVGLDLGLDKYYHYVKAFGFGKVTGIDLPGEASGILVPEKKAQQIDLATMAFGQANAVTSIQLTTAVAAVANGGILMKPHLVKQVIDNNGKVIKKCDPEAVRRVISEETAHQLCLILEDEVTLGTGQNAYIEGYRVAGKTGTAEKSKPGGGYLSNEYIASFIGFAPAVNPRLVCMVIVDAPQGYPYYGGWVAAPAFKNIMEDALQYLEVPMHKSQENDKTLEKVEYVLVPDVVNLPLAEALAILNERGLKSKVSGSGNIVWQQTPQPRTKLQPGAQVIISLSPFDQGEKDGEVTIPDLQGKSMREVAKILSDLGLHLIPEGYGLAWEQSPAAGKVVTGGSSIKVKFQPVGE